MRTTEVQGPLQAREIFHLEFLRRLSQKLKTGRYALKGGVNLRLFFSSPRYSEDIDLDVRDITVENLGDIVMDILTSSSFRDVCASFGIRTVTPPDLARAKQTETTQRFKVHLTASGGEDYFTKIEFSRRGMQQGAVVEPVRAEVLRQYRLPPLLCSHYDAGSAFVQKINALVHRNAIQARDIFDMHVLDTQAEIAKDRIIRVEPATLRRAVDNLYSVEFAQFRDTVVEYFAQQDREAFDSAAIWDNIRLSVAHRIEDLL
jgi:predicted nucleotidyltransferase component of viral defense system